jgi:hypothetical protein
MAEALDLWLPDVLQYVDAFFSEDDIAKGSRPDATLADQLEAAGFGITCLTSENLNAPWILYETGALAHRFKGRACPYLLDVEPAHVPPPLGKLQCARANKLDTLKLLKSIEEASSERIGDRLPRVFEQWWPALENRLKAISSAAEPQPLARGRARGAEDMLAEILEALREGTRTAADIKRLEAAVAQLQVERDALIHELTLARVNRQEETRLRDLKAKKSLSDLLQDWSRRAGPVAADDPSHLSRLADLVEQAVTRTEAEGSLPEDGGRIDRVSSVRDPVRDTSSEGSRPADNEK